MNLPKLSIIVPVYNVAPCLHRCVDSILSQSFTDFELLLIDDGSTDGSRGICDEYATIDARIKVFHKENSGVSSARNFGLEVAKGEWVFFADADDELINNGLQVLYNLTENDIDLVLAGYERYDENNNCVFKIDKNIQYQLSTEEAIEYVYHAPLYGYMGYIWSKLFRLSIIKSHHLHFDINIYYNEDRLFIIKYICESSLKKCIATSQAVYKYIARKNSVMSQLSHHFNKRFSTDLDAEIQMEEIINNSHFSSKLSKMAEEGVIASYSRIRAYMRRNHYYSIPFIISLTSKIGIANYWEYVKLRIGKICTKIKKAYAKTTYRNSTCI